MRRLPILLIVLALTGCSSNARDDEPTGTVTVFADTSLAGVFTDLGRQLEGAHPGLTVDFDFAAGATSATRLTGGAAADVFAAGTDAMDVVTNNGIVSRAPALFATRPDASGAQVGYAICTLTDAPDPAGALAFVQLVRSDGGRAALTAAGFGHP